MSLLAIESELFNNIDFEDGHHYEFTIVKNRKENQ